MTTKAKQFENEMAEIAHAKANAETRLSEVKKEMALMKQTLEKKSLEDQERQKVSVNSGFLKLKFVSAKSLRHPRIRSQ